MQTIRDPPKDGVKLYLLNPGRKVIVVNGYPPLLASLIAFDTSCLLVGRHGIRNSPSDGHRKNYMKNQ